MSGRVKKPYDVEDLAYRAYVESMRTGCAQELAGEALFVLHETCKVDAIKEFDQHPRTSKFKKKLVQAARDSLIFRIELEHKRIRDLGENERLLAAVSQIQPIQPKKQSQQSMDIAAGPSNDVVDSNTPQNDERAFDDPERAKLDEQRTKDAQLLRDQVDQILKQGGHPEKQTQELEDQVREEMQKITSLNRQAVPVSVRKNKKRKRTLWEKFLGFIYYYKEEETDEIPYGAQGSDVEDDNGLDTLDKMPHGKFGRLDFDYSSLPSSAGTVSKNYSSGRQIARIDLSKTDENSDTEVKQPVTSDPGEPEVSPSAMEDPEETRRKKSADENPGETGTKQSENAEEMKVKSPAAGEIVVIHSATENSVVDTLKPVEETSAKTEVKQIDLASTSHVMTSLKDYVRMEKSSDVPDEVVQGKNSVHEVNRLELEKSPPPHHSSSDESEHSEVVLRRVHKITPPASSSEKLQRPRKKYADDSSSDDSSSSMHGLEKRLSVSTGRLPYIDAVIFSDDRKVKRYRRKSDIPPSSKLSLSRKNSKTKRASEILNIPWERHSWHGKVKKKKNQIKKQSEFETGKMMYSGPAHKDATERVKSAELVKNEQKIEFEKASRYAAMKLVNEIAEKHQNDEVHLSTTQDGTGHSVDTVSTEELQNVPENTVGYLNFSRADVSMLLSDVQFTVADSRLTEADIQAITLSSSSTSEYEEHYSEKETCYNSYAKNASEKFSSDTDQSDHEFGTDNVGLDEVDLLHHSDEELRDDVFEAAPEETSVKKVETKQTRVISLDSNDLEDVILKVSEMYKHKHHVSAYNLEKSGSERSSLLKRGISAEAMSTTSTVERRRTLLPPTVLFSGEVEPLDLSVAQNSHRLI